MERGELLTVVSTGKGADKPCRNLALIDWIARKRLSIYNKRGTLDYESTLRNVTLAATTKSDTKYGTKACTVQPS